MFKIFRVAGHSMWPTLESKDWAFCYQTNKFSVGSIVVFKMSPFGFVIKRVCEIQENYFRVEGDNQEVSSPIYQLNIQRSEKIWVAFAIFSNARRSFFLVSPNNQEEVSNT